ncbi:MBL fold metallo-hydrolase [Limobrevibacterium gyesilva]|uniref:MBL fold metallo-hydrolase n=1 Tax=Limobrevibacterium gyesilva TaxID=2991712 RepID=A0AA41YNL5_9PROT|nr:MBL fold metallo-hydrolase [Limobrevibacterium gyesilva]MCW3477201.1 MBL fold metallo-hydrolase [Limobrevibacterium gyesilva]
MRMHPDVTAFFDEATNTITYLVSDPATQRAAIIDPVLDYDAASGRTGTANADRVVAAVRDQGLTVDWLLETHVHADHLSGAPYLKRRLAELGLGQAKIAIGEHIRRVQEVFRTLFNAEPSFVTDGRQFDHLFADGERFPIGQLLADVLHTPGHTPACLTYVVGDAAFVGDTLFMPDFGTARADFPGGDAAALYRSIHRILALPGHTRIFTAHDYKAPGRDKYAWESTVAEQRTRNVHVHDGISEADFVALRTARDRTLAVPKLLLPSVQVNMRAGQRPPAEDNGVCYLKIPLDTF